MNVICSIKLDELKMKLIKMILWCTEFLNFRVDLTWESCVEVIPFYFNSSNRIKIANFLYKNYYT